MIFTRRGAPITGIEQDYRRGKLSLFCGRHPKRESVLVGDQGDELGEVIEYAVAIKNTCEDLESIDRKMTAGDRSVGGALFPSR